MEARYVPIALVVLTSASIIGTFRMTHAADSDSPVATYSQGALHVEIPYRAPRAGAGVLTIEVLNPEDAVVGVSEHRVALAEGNGSWRQDLKPDKPLGTDE